MPPFSTEVQAPLLPAHLLHYLLLQSSQTSIHLKERDQFLSCCMWHGSWYQVSMMVPSPNITYASASKFFSPPSPHSSFPTYGASCSLQNQSIGWAPMCVGDDWFMILPLQHYTLAYFASCWSVLKPFSPWVHVCLHTV